MIKLETRDALIGFLLQYKSVAMATITTKTEQKLNKKDVATKKIPNQLGKVFKVNVLEVEMNADYGDKVNDTLLMEGKSPTFEVSAAKWGTALSKSIDEQNGQHYFKGIVAKKLTPTYYEKENGEKITYPEFEQFVPAASGSASAQGVDNEVIYRKWKIDSIIYFKIPGIVEYMQD